MRHIQRNLHYFNKDLREVAFTSLTVKTFERIVLTFLNSNNLVDHLHFAYRDSRCVENVTLTMLQLPQSHVEKVGTY